MVAELAAIAVALFAAMAELLHARRCRRLASLAFGPSHRPARWVLFAPTLRIAAMTALAWGLVVLMTAPPRMHKSKEITDKERKHIILVLDVSPSMRLVDAGPDHKQSRSKRAASVMESFFRRVPVEHYLLTVIAVYNGAKPVVIDTKDLDVVRNILNDLPLSHAFPTGKTDLFAGLGEAAKIAHPWKPRSTLVMLVTDGDSVPSTGMPRMPASVSDTLIVGVGDSRVGTFIEGHQSRQDSTTLRQTAVRLNGAYHDGNEKHLSTSLLTQLTGVAERRALDMLTKREYALIACGAGATTIALLPMLLHYLGTRWRPGVSVNLRSAGGRERVAA